MDWLLREIKQEVTHAEKDLAKIKLKVGSFSKGTEIEKTVGGKRTLTIVTVIAGTVGLFGTVIMFGASDDCGKMGISSPAKRKPKHMHKTLKNWAPKR